MRAWILALGLVLTACDSTGEACETDGATRCMENAAEVCTDGEWMVDDDCEANGEECMQDDSMMEGAAHCMPAM